MSEQILTQILEQLKTLNIRVDSMDSRFDGIDTRLDGIDSRFDGIDTRLDGIDSRFDGIDTHLDGIDSRFDGIDTRLDGMDSRFDGMDSRFDNMDSRLDSMDSRLASLETDVTEIKSHTNDIPAIKQAVLETLELSKQNKTSLHSFERKVSSELTTHGHSIDILNRRQLKLEADLESLKNR